MAKRLLICAWLVVSGLAHGDGMQALEQFLKNIHNGQGRFTQTVTLPIKQGETVARSRRSSGQWAFERPDKFRFSYQKPFEQHLVSDGKTLWNYDVDLDQLSASPLRQVFGQTPAVLLSGASLRHLQTLFLFKTEVSTDALQWVHATPLSKESGIVSIRLAFDAAVTPIRLLHMQVHDGLGQIVRVDLTDVTYNQTLSPRLFSQPKPAERSKS